MEERIEKKEENTVQGRKRNTIIKEVDAKEKKILLGITCKSEES